MIVLVYDPVLGASFAVVWQTAVTLFARGCRSLGPIYFLLSRHIYPGDAHRPRDTGSRTQRD
jgi:hypothetical protein